jgi:hypothetical protein
MLKRILLGSVFLFSASAWAQTANFYQFPVPLPGATFYVCPVQTQNPCPSPVTIYADQGLTIPIPQPAQTGVTGMFGFWLPGGQYTIQIQQPYNFVYIINLGGGGGGSGSVTNVSIGNLNPLFTSSVGNPNTTPNITFTLLSALPHRWFGNNAGSTGPPNFSLIGTADLPYTYSGNTTTLATTAGALISGHGVKLDASGNLVDSGGVFGPAGSTSQLQFNNGGIFGGISSVAPGSLLASQGVSAAPAFQTKAQIDVRDGFGGSGGVDCTGVADSTTSLQAMINNAPDYSSFLFPAGCKVKVSGTTAITIDQRFGLQFEFKGRNGNNCNAGASTPAELFYNQTYGAGNRVLYVNRSQDIEFRNITVNVNGGGDIGIDIDQVGATPPIATRQDYFFPCIVNTGNRNSSFKGIRVSNSAISNVENMHFYHPDFQCSAQAVTGANSNGYGIWFAGSANLKNEIIEDARSTNCSGTMLTQFGSDLTYRDGLCSSCYADVTMGGFNDMLSGWRSEFANNPVSIVNGTGPHTLLHNDFAAVTGPAVIDCPSGCGQVVAIGNEADSSATPWFNTHSGGGSLFAAGNRFSNLGPLDWDYSWRFEPSGGGQDNSWISSSLRITPSHTNLGSFNLPSPPLIFETVSGVAHNYDSFIVENFAEGPLSNTPTSENFSIFYNGTNTSYLTLGATIVDLNVGPNATSASTVAAISPNGTLGGTTWCYKSVARTLNGHSAASSALCTNGGNATLNSTNYNVVLVNPYSGAIAYDIYRTTAGGTPNTTGKIGSITPKWVNGGGTVAGAISLADTGLAGDATTAPTTNTTGSAVFGAGVQLASITFANLPASVNGTMYYCSDCKNVTDDTTGTFDSAAASGGHGTNVLRENGAWRVH